MCARHSLWQSWKSVNLSQDIIFRPTCVASLDVTQHRPRTWQCYNVTSEWALTLSQAWCEWSLSFRLFVLWPWSLHSALSIILVCSHTHPRLIPGPWLTAVHTLLSVATSQINHKQLLTLDKSYSHSPHKTHKTNKINKMNFIIYLRI